MKAQPGQTVKLWTDWEGAPDDPPLDVEYVVTEGARGFGSAYLVTEIRKMERSAHPNRYALRCVKLAGLQDVDTTKRVMVLRWHARRRQP